MALAGARVIAASVLRPAPLLQTGRITRPAVRIHACLAAHRGGCVADLYTVLATIDFGEPIRFFAFTFPCQYHNECADSKNQPDEHDEF